MNPHLTYNLAQAHTADLIREAERQRLAHATARRPPRPRAAIRRILGSVPRGGITSVPTASTRRGDC
jgi:hypothetical protein